MAALSSSVWLSQLSELLNSRVSRHMYQYQRLQQDSIRLLRLAPPEGDSEDIECEIIHVSLSDRIKYEALSYVWGDPVQSRKIRVKSSGASFGSQKKVLPITDSLFTALRDLRYKTEPRNLWVDQLSINQRDTEERNAQVARMGEIYSKASCTVVWLGPGGADAYLLQDLYNSLSRVTSIGADSNDVLVLDQKALARMVGTSYKDELKDEMIRRRRRLLETILGLPWFCRAWVYQEAVVAPKVDIVWGDIILPLNFVTGLIVSVYGIAKSAEEGRWHRRIKQTRGFAPVRTIYHDREAHMKGQLNYLDVLWHARKYLDASNPRDYVYAFRSVNKQFNISSRPSQRAVTPLQDLIQIRYQDSVEEIFTDLALVAMQISSSLDILQYVVPTKPQRTPSSLPSWVPDWKDRHFVCGSPIFVPGVPSHLSACGGEKHTTTSMTDRRQLHVRGYIIGHVETVLKHSFKHTYYTPTLTEALKLEDLETLLVTEVEKIGIGNNPSWLQTNRRETLLRTIVANGSFTTSSTICHSLKDLLCAYDNEGDGQSDPTGDADAETQSKLRHYLRQTSEVASGKRVFLTTSLDIGLGFSTVRKGDLVYILHGCKTPCILRRSIVSVDQYTFIGLCYLHEWMNGTEQPARDRERLDHMVESLVLV